ncbi:MAG: serine hydrolase domain-containing protein [Opitutaceae bacterium]
MLFRPLQRLAVLFFVAAVLLTRPVASAPGGQSSVAGFDAARLNRLDVLIQGHIDQGQLAGGVLYLTRDGKTVRNQPYGWLDTAAKRPMQPDAIFRIASMSKAITSVAIMILYEEGKFMLHDPVSKYIPAFKSSTVAVAPGPDAPPGTTFVTVPAKRPIQIRDLLTHTAGLTYGDGLAVELYKKAGLHGWYFADKNETIGDCINRLATLPLHGHPGEAWQYGYATDVLGYLVEVVSGQPLDRFIEERICRPLKMVDTAFFLPLEKAGRLAPVYGVEKGALVLNETVEQSDYVKGPRKCFSGGAGLLSTAQDYGRFLQMLLGRGVLDGVRVLSPKSVELMHANHTGDLYRRDTSAFGLGFWVNQDPGFFGELGSEGAYGWGSAYYPQYFIDPKERLVGIFMTQLRPAGGLDLNQKFKVMIYQALVE